MLNMDYRQRALIVLGTQFGVDRKRLKGLMQHYMTLNSGKILKDLSLGIKIISLLVYINLRSSPVPVSLCEKLYAMTGIMVRSIISSQMHALE